MARLKSGVAIVVSLAIGMAVWWAVYAYISTVFRPSMWWEVPAMELLVAIPCVLVMLLMLHSLGKILGLEQGERKRSINGGI